MLAQDTEVGARPGLKEVARQAPQIIVIGVGNDYRRDDAAGLIAARVIRMRLAALAGDVQAQVLECTGGSFELIEDWQNADVVVLIDAVSAGSDPGTIYRIEIGSQPLPSYLFHYSTHGFNLANTVELARILGKLPPKVMLFGIEGGDFSEGAGLTGDVALAIERVIDAALRYVGECAPSLKAN